MNHTLAALLLVTCAFAACSKTEAPASAPPTLPDTPTPAAATTGGVPARLCDVLRQTAPEVKGMPEVGARAQLVMAIAGAFDSDAGSLATVSSDIDAIASAGCPEVREPLLAATRAKSLQEAVR